MAMQNLDLDAFSVHCLEICRIFRFIADIASRLPLIMAIAKFLSSVQLFWSFKTMARPLSVSGAKVGFSASSQNDAVSLIFWSGGQR